MYYRRDPFGDAHSLSPTTTAAKKMPDRTLPTDKILIWDGRRVNIHCPKQDYWLMETPTTQDLAAWYVRIKTNFPGTPAVGTKRDIDSAFARCRIRPDAASMFSIEFLAKGGAGDVGVIFFYMVTPFGFAGSPGIFGRVMQGVKWLHSQFSPDDPLWDGVHQFWCEIFADDGIFAEATIGTRDEQSVAKWEWAATQLLGPTAISGKKLIPEGQWGQGLVLLGFQVNLGRSEISRPDPKLVGAYNLVRQDVLNPGNYAIPSQALQGFRGCMNRWGNTHRLWRWLVEPANQLLGQTDTNLLWIRCSDPGKWLAFWHAIQFRREVSTDESNWRLHFHGTFSELFGVHAEMSFPSIARRCVWFSGDATPAVSRGLTGAIGSISTARR